jgi:hypothetical protein
MPVSTIYITNNSSSCDITVEENITTSSCTDYLLRLNPKVNNMGPFDIIVVTGAVFQTYTGITHTELMNGIQLPLNCP